MAIVIAQDGRRINTDFFIDYGIEIRGKSHALVATVFSPVSVRSQVLFAGDEAECRKSEKLLDYVLGVKSFSSLANVEGVI